MVTLESVYRDRANVLILYDLLKERTPNQSISHKEMPTMEDHQKFVYSSPYLIWSIIKYMDEPVGAIYLTHQREVGIFVFKRYRGNGFAEQAIKALMRRVPGRFLANVNPKNRASKRLFRKLGGKKIQETFEL